MPPPSRCLHTLPLRTLDNALPTRSPRHHPIISLPSRSIQHRHASSAVGPAKGAKTLRLKKKGRPEKTARPPEPGERKALRKRIVLSNTNALTVRDVQPLSMAMEEMQAAEVQAIPAACIDQLRAVEAFKPHSQQIHPRQTHPLGKTQTPLPHQGQRHSLRSAHPRPKRPRPRMAHLPGLLARNHTCKFRNRCQESG